MTASRITARFGLSIVGVLATLLASVHVEAAPPVQVTAADPSSAPQGTVSLDVAVSGSGFDSTAAVSFLVTGTTNPGGITVKKVTVSGSKKLVATIEIADAAVVTKFDIEVQLSGGRKGKGTSLFAVLSKANGDACAVGGLDFPAFAFWRTAGNTREIFVADSTGQCVRSVLKSSTFQGSEVEFSYPVNGTTNRGRITWLESGPTYVSVDFTANTASNQLTVFAKKTIRTGNGGYFSLGKDGSAWYSNRYLSSGATIIEKTTIDSVGSPVPNSTVTVVEIPTGAVLGPFSVNGSGTYLFADTKSVAGPRQLVWIPLDGTNEIHVLAEHPSDGEYAGKQFIATANPSLDLVVYDDYIPIAQQTSGCDPLVIKEIGGATVPYPPPLAYGLKPTWVNDKVLADGRTPKLHDVGCDYTGTIMQLDPNTGVQTPLVTGRDADGR